MGPLGQTDFTLRAPNDPNQGGTSEGVVSPRTMNNPRQLAFIDGRLFVADQQNHRILVFTSNR